MKLSPISSPIARQVSERTRVLNQQIVAFVNGIHARGDELAVAQGCTFSQIHAVFAVNAECAAAAPFRRRLDYLVFAGRLQASGKGPSRLFRPAEPDDESQQLAQSQPPAQVAPPTVQAAQYDLMRASLYVPDAGAALRPGALDFKSKASYGLRC